MELEAAAGRDRRDHAPGLGVGWVGWGPRSNPEPDSNPDPARVLLASRAPAAAVPASRRPCVLSAPPPERPALGGSSAPPRPRAGPAPLVASGPATVEGDGGGHDRTWTGRCVCARGVSGLAPSSCPRGRVPPPLSSPPDSCRWAAAGGGRGRGWPGSSSWREGGGGGGVCGRSPHPPPAQGWKPPSTGLVHGGVTTAGREGRAGSARGCTDRS